MVSAAAMNSAAPLIKEGLQYIAVELAKVTIDQFNDLVINVQDRRAVNALLREHKEKTFLIHNYVDELLNKEISDDSIDRIFSEIRLGIVDLEKINQKLRTYQRR